MTKTTTGWLVMAAALLAMTMGMTACSNEGDDILGGNGSEQPKETAGVRVTVSAGISDPTSSPSRTMEGSAGTTRSAVTKDGTARTLKFTTGDRLYIYAVLDYDTENNRPKRLMTGTLDMQGTPTGEDLQASFGGELTVYKWDGSQYIVDPDQTVKDGAVQAADPLAVSYDYCTAIGRGSLFCATLVHKDAGSDFETVADNTIDLFGTAYYITGIAPDVETLMTSTLPVRAYNYDKVSHGINLNDVSDAIFNCSVSGLPSDGVYKVSRVIVLPSYGDVPESVGNVTVTDGATAFAFRYNADDREYGYKINLTKGSDTYTIDLGSRVLAPKVYNVTRQFIGTTAYNPKDLATPLTMEALTGGTIVVRNPREGMQYSLNGGDKTTMSGNTTISGLAVGDKVQFYGNGTSITTYCTSSSNCTWITGGTAEVKLYGNIMSLVDETGYATNTTLTAVAAFYTLFNGNSTLKDASGLLLPATTLTQYCYYSLFGNCTGLTTAPALPAMTLASDCYTYMFDGCTSLTTAPALPATTLASNCYQKMFFGCSSLTTAPVLPATTLVNGCYKDMFYACESLNSVTCLATSKTSTSTENWLGLVAETGTFYKAASMNSWARGADGIPSDWTVVNAQ